jgi:hypothetical protein
LKTEWWGSPLAQEEKYQEENSLDKRIIIISTMTIIATTRMKQLMTNKYSKSPMLNVY